MKNPSKPSLIFNIPIRIKYGILGVILLYVLLLISSFLMSTFFVNESFKVRISAAMPEAKCARQYHKREANPLKIWDFYLNLDYWLASYRLPASLINNHECVQLLMENMVSYGYPVSVVFINQEGKIVLKVRSAF